MYTKSALMASYPHIIIIIIIITFYCTGNLCNRKDRTLAPCSSRACLFSVTNPQANLHVKFLETDCCQGILNPYTFYFPAISYTGTASAGTSEREAGLTSPDVQVETSVASDPRIIITFIYNFCRVRNHNSVTVGSLVCFCFSDVGRHFSL